MSINLQKMKVDVLFLAANTFSSLQHKASQQQDIEGIWMLSEDGKCHIILLTIPQFCILR